MCGIWGVSCIDTVIEKKALLEIIKKLMILSEARGKDASGLAVMQGTKLNVIRKAMPSHIILKDEQFKDFVKENVVDSTNDNIWVIGHSRLVTNGTQYDPNNNQPVAKKNMALVHNGIVVNEQELWKNISNSEREFEVDSEVILETFENKRSNLKDNESAIQETYRCIKGMSSTIMLIQDRHTLIASTNNGSLYKAQSEDGKLVIFASERLILERLLLKTPKLESLISKSSIIQIGINKSVIISDDCHINPDAISITQDTKRTLVSTNLCGLNYKNYEIDFDRIKRIRRCTKCVLPATMPFIEFDENGVCNYCRGYQKAEYKGKAALDDWNRRHHDSGKEAVVSFSGGRDSSFGLHYFVNEMGIIPKAYCYDWGMVTDIARRNQSRMCQQLGVEFILVSADIGKKRKNIKLNVEAWLKKPSLGIVPLFMAGDKHYFYYANKVREDYNLDSVLVASNPFEKTYFKSGFCGIKPDILKKEYHRMDMERLPAYDVFAMSRYYAQQFVKNRSYFNSSLIDTAAAAVSYYIIPHDYFRLFDYIPWNEDEIDEVLLGEYGWERAKDTECTWRIGDGTAPFYNYIYCLVAGFTENDTLRSNQIREGMITREKALEYVYRDNQPRFDSLKWYFDAIQVNMEDALKIIGRIPKLY